MRDFKLSPADFIGEVIAMASSNRALGDRPGDVSDGSYSREDRRELGVLGAGVRSLVWVVLDGLSCDESTRIDPLGPSLSTGRGRCLGFEETEVDLLDSLGAVALSDCSGAGGVLLMIEVDGIDEAMMMGVIGFANN